ncbi:hypothetical protein K1719_043779 [Acacia pycnantha]|nr:hypothetical protein K1719_043779 [Acacia pycnantha]
MSENEIELQQPLPSSQPSDHLSSNLLQQQHVKDNEVTVDMKEMIQDCGDGALLPECCIYRVPHILRRHNEEAYTPKLVSVGPFHYGNERLKDMERHKQIMFKRFTHNAERVRSSSDDLVHLVKHLEPKVRASYSETINLTKQELVKLTLTDAGFIIQLFIMRWDGLHNDAKLSPSFQSYIFEDAKLSLPSFQSYIFEDAKLSLPSFQSYIFEDLHLFENQLPFFVIEELFNTAFPCDSRGSLPSFLELTYRYFGYFNRERYFKPNVDFKIRHFTDLVRLFYLQGEVFRRKPFSMDQRFGTHIPSYSANALQEAGIVLRKARMSTCLLDLKLSGHVIEIPKIDVGDDTELVFRNMIALEQCLYVDDAYITGYARVLNCLIDTHKDVDLLVGKKIVSNFILGDANDVASLFRGLPKNAPVATFDSKYLDICERLNHHCEDPFYKMKAMLMRDYFRTPWDTVNSLATMTLLYLALIQTIFSILQKKVQVSIRSQNKWKPDLEVFGKVGLEYNMYGLTGKHYGQS